MNRIGAMTNHPPSMLHDVRQQLTTEVDFLSGAIAREASAPAYRAAAHRGLPADQGKEAGWTFKNENKPVIVQRSREN